MGTLAESRLLALDSLKYSNKVESPINRSVKAVISRKPEYELTQTSVKAVISREPDYELTQTSVKAVISREPEYELTQTFLCFFIFYIHKIGIVVLSA